jgi:hypothetical protein
MNNTLAMIASMLLMAALTVALIHGCDRQIQIESHHLESKYHVYYFAPCCSIFLSSRIICDYSFAHYCESDEMNHLEHIWLGAFFGAFFTALIFKAKNHD